MSSPSSSAQHARQALADRLRELRVAAELTGIELAERCGWHRTKVSKLEHAATSPTAGDIRAWCSACGVPQLGDELVAERHAADSLWLDWRRMERNGLRHAQESVRELYERTRLLRVYSPVMIPGPVQTGPYIRAVLQAIRARRAIEVDDVDEAVAERIDRQHAVLQGPGQVVVLVEEAALRYRIGGAEVMAGQLGHLLSAASLPTLSLGVIPLDADRTTHWPVEMFFMFDDVQVNVELVSGFLTITDPREIAMYESAVTELAATAVYGRTARARIMAAIDALA
ncbi:helix-turn-helix domain-containing protein [Actinomadura hibisca]|uniref:helix-turn-helix domain-containing protein n=1 Tax=Actinomadura hibisca TaxID=68565 RepID=UPI000830FB06|nr:helix-turn-helix transcriptional regulator [Actinomadura hibisca]